MLHEASLDGGLGFCHQELPTLLPDEYHGPLVVALDSNVLIDLQQHGAALMNDDPLPDRVAADAAYLQDLDGLADLLNTWLLRDIRFIVTPRSKTDAKKFSQRFLDTRLPAIDALAESLAFQLGDWNFPPPSEGVPPAAFGDETGLPEGADRDLVLEAQAVGAHAFLTRDRLILERTALTGPQTVVLSPGSLASEMQAAGVQLFRGGVCGDARCPYAGWPFPAPDMGRWAGLLSILS
ncbi:hypothetical protein [Streptomyces sp. OR43]|uniref:hypothetical protein n=1 Tax=Streptomyces sp. or43 TaxID=2478957 RepID=UPI0011CD51C4|nr:hypothetical protein [Streptomyces sp. or43]